MIGILFLIVHHLLLVQFCLPVLCQQKADSSLDGSNGSISNATDSELPNMIDVSSPSLVATERFSSTLMSSTEGFSTATNMNRMPSDAFHSSLSPAKMSSASMAPEVPTPLISPDTASITMASSMPSANTSMSPGTASTWMASEMSSTSMAIEISSPPMPPAEVSSPSTMAQDALNTSMATEASSSGRATEVSNTPIVMKNVSSTSMPLNASSTSMAPVNSSSKRSDTSSVRRSTAPEASMTSINTAMPPEPSSTLMASDVSNYSTTTENIGTSMPLDVINSSVTPANTLSFSLVPAASSASMPSEVSNTSTPPGTLLAPEVTDPLTSTTEMIRRKYTSSTSMASNQSSGSTVVDTEEEYCPTIEEEEGLLERLRSAIPFLGLYAKKKDGPKKPPFNPLEVIEVNVRLFGRVYNTERQKYQNCGGTLISSRHVLTAAHCFFDANTVCSSNYTGTLAESLARNLFAEGTDIAKSNFTMNNTLIELDGICLPNEFCKEKECACLSPNLTRTVNVKRAFIPTSFVESHCRLGDIAVLELAEPVASRRVKLARAETPIPRCRRMYASGYGYNPKWRSWLEPDELMTVRVQLEKGCPPANWQPDAICADEAGPQSNACEGDSGAALRDKEANIFGIVAYGTLCDVMLDYEQRGMPREKRLYAGAVYTNVTFYLPFICGIIGRAENGTMEMESSGCRPGDVVEMEQQPFFELARDGRIRGRVADFGGNGGSWTVEE